MFTVKREYHDRLMNAAQTYVSMLVEIRHAEKLTDLEKLDVLTRVNTHRRLFKQLTQNFKKELTSSLE